jgi:hypothetical protein
MLEITGKVINIIIQELVQFVKNVNGGIVMGNQVPEDVLFLALKF